ncbi:xanthine dehydrogenase family protein molybdopterin-binding subunit [Desulfuribacillus alkaliarsenatis]|uniref:Aldehyde oxidase n=1 Tax=Desulfuribacillus alkaliarsenatis TaxID=766136 RepID=A0A1E5G0F4_9FIRM|nr:xanthine dehydrogenase family protein molybdopterin-binding subunit [Desulfuribacillus alkaliarsenatis]OEF96302.1 aldehyde oxidase [Desulfuribacillus alkaliarsenatis]
MSIGNSVIRKESYDKVSGSAKYLEDKQAVEMLHIKLVISTYAHAKINSINTENAWKIPGVRAIITGKEVPLTGEEIQDRPILAVERVRYHGEPVAAVVADTPVIAQQAADLITVMYEPLPVVNNPTQALAENAPLVHEKLEEYKKIQHVYPEPNTNVANREKIRKGDIDKGWAESYHRVESSFSFSPSDHIAMETRCVTAEIKKDGTVIVGSTSQGPFMVKKKLAEYLGLDVGKIIVNTPLVGGGYGGKVPIQLELIAYLASKAVGGKPVKLFNSREQDMITSPVHIGLDANIKLGCDKEGILKVAEITYLFDTGAYSDKGATIARAAAVSCTGPYNVENISCDSLAVYTNHPYATAFRGFSHSEALFVFERAMDMLAQKVGIDSLELRLRNAIKPGHTTPTQMTLNKSNIGNVEKCITRLKELMRWDEGQRIQLDSTKIRAKGISSIWKTSTIDTHASSGVILTFNPDGSINLISGVIEIGTATKTVLAQMVADRMRMDIDKVYVRMEVDTQTTPEHWKTVASRGTFMAGRAVIKAVDDLIKQLKDVATHVLVCAAEDLEVADGKVFIRDEPSVFCHIKDIAYGYKNPNGNAIGGQIVGRGDYILRHLTHMHHETGAGKPGPEWTVGAQGVEIEYDTRTYTYKILKAYSVIDVGKVLNQKAALGQVMGAMSMGLSFAARESFEFDNQGKVLNPRLRTYVPTHFGEHPEYIIDFLDTPHLDAAYGARGLGEHGLIGMPAALANSLSTATGCNINRLPLVPENVWKITQQAGDIK